MASHLDRVGQQIGDYRLLRWLGGGGFGDVYLAEHVRDRSQVAIKLLQIRLSSNKEYLLTCLQGFFDRDQRSIEDFTHLFLRHVRLFGYALDQFLLSYNFWDDLFCIRHRSVSF